jgi:nicotinamidase-related amidase
LTPKNGEKVIGKQFPSSFAKTDLNEYLEGIGIKKIVLVGYMAHVCVSTTARAGVELGYDVLLAADGIGDRDIPGASGKDVTEVSFFDILTVEWCVADWPVVDGAFGAR